MVIVISGWEKALLITAVRPLLPVAAGTAGAIEGFLVVQILVWVHLFAIVHDLDVYMRAG